MSLALEHRTPEMIRDYEKIERNERGPSTSISPFAELVPWQNSLCSLSYCWERLVKIYLTECSLPRRHAFAAADRSHRTPSTGLSSNVSSIYKH